MESNSTLTTDPDMVNIAELLETMGVNMKGIQPEGKCPKCHGPFKFNKNKSYYECPEHLTAPRRFSVQIYHDGKRIRRGTDLEGKTLESVTDALNLIKQINKEIDKDQFNIKKWQTRKGINFNCESYVWKWQKEKIDDLAPSNRIGTYIKYYLIPYFKGADIRRVVSLKPFYKELDKLSPSDRKLAKGYKKVVMDNTYNFFTWAKNYMWEEWQIVIQEPTRPNISVPEYEPETVERETQLAFLDLVDTEHISIFTFLIFQGARPSEVRALKGDCINGDTVTYKRTFSDGQLMERTKTDQNRDNYLFPETIEQLPKVFPGQFLFRINNKAYSKNQLNDLYRAYLKKYNDKHGTTLNLTLYEFTKYSFGTQFINANPKHAKLLQGHFGHSSAKMTDRYAKLKTVDGFRKMNNVTAIK